MCFNARVSLITYFIGLAGCFQLYNNGFIPEAIFYAWVVHMQLIEFFIWTNQPCSSNTNTTTDVIKNNIFFSKMGIIINHLEPFILWIAILYFSKIKLSTTINIIMILFLLFTIIYTKYVFNKNTITTVTDQSAPHLHWKWTEGPHFVLYYCFFLLVLVLLSLYGLPNGHINAILVIISYTISYIIYNDKHSTGAVWCFAAAFAPIILNYIYLKN